MQPDDYSMCAQHQSPMMWMCHECNKDPPDALCANCALEHQLQSHHHGNKFGTVAAVIRSDSEALQKWLSPTIGQTLDGFKQRITGVVRDFNGEIRETQLEIGRVQSELDRMKKAVAVKDAEARKKMGKAMQIEAGMDRVRAAIVSQTGKLVGKKDLKMKEVKELLKQAKKKMVVKERKMNKLLANMEQTTGELKSAHLEMRFELRNEGDNRNGYIADLFRSSLETCNALITEFKATLEEKKAAIDKQQELQKKGDMIKELNESLKKVEGGIGPALGEVNVQLEQLKLLNEKAVEVREFRRILDAEGEKVRIAKAKEERNMPLSAEKGGRTLLTKL